MFSMAQSNESPTIEAIEGCPLIEQLHDDPNDVAVFLKALYDRS
jgi:hypothetical protein